LPTKLIIDIIQSLNIYAKGFLIKEVFEFFVVSIIQASSIGYSYGKIKVPLFPQFSPHEFCINNPFSFHP
jgi:hypothetical protein